MGKLLGDIFPIMNRLKQKDVISPMLFNFALEHGIKGFQVKQNGFKLNGKHNLSVCLMTFVYRTQTYMLLW